MAIYDKNGNNIQTSYDINGRSVYTAYDIDGHTVFTVTPLPVPSGDLFADETIMLPDLYEVGKGFTCTGLAYDEPTNTFLVGDIVALQPNEQASGKIVRLSNDFSTVVESISIPFAGPQGVTIDTKRNTMWVCSPNDNKLYQLRYDGTIISSFSVTSPTGVAYERTNDTLWVLTYDNKIKRYDILGSLLETYDFAYQETLDQCFLDETRGLMYITAGSNYSGRNNVYCFNISTHEQSISCTVDSYAVEGIWIGDTDKMVILNDGYYHSAYVPYNQANIYTLS